MRLAKLWRSDGMDDNRLLELRKNVNRILRNNQILPEDASRLRDARVRMKDDEAYIELLETLLAYRQRVALLEGLARDRSFDGIGWARQIIFD